MRWHPRLVFIAQAIVIPLGFVGFTALGIWWLVQGQTRAAAIAFAIALSGPVSVALYLGLYHGFVRLARRRSTTDSIEVKVDGPIALRWTEKALREVVPDLEPQIELERRILTTLVPASRRSGGERIVAVVQPANGGSRIEITSFCVGPQLVDYGKNRENVDRVVAALASFESASQQP